MEVKTTLLPEEKRKEIPKDDMKLGFGKTFTDHMFAMDYEEGKGWNNARIQPFGPLSLHPACMSLHYGQEIFEGLKAYRGKDDGVYLFRHKNNLERMNGSCERLVMPKLDIEEVSKALKQLVNIEKDWIPRTHGCALYIRPTMIAMDPFLGVRPSNTYLFFIILSPVAAYYPEGFNPVKIYVSQDYVRAVKGGVGDAKAAGNYASGLRAQTIAKKAGYTQVLWLDAVERKYVEEVGTMNIWFKFKDELVTSPLTGSILPGVTRDAVLQIAQKWGMPINQRKVSIDEVIEGAKSGDLEECFGCGTAAIISPVKAIWHKGEEVTIGNGSTGPTAQKLYNFILDLQYGNAEDPFGWVERIDK